jgi:calpain, invertebrate
MGVPTMLKSEKAALAACRGLFKEVTKKKMSKWKDPDFGPTDDKDGDGQGARSLYPEGRIPSPGYIAPKDVTWLYSEDRLSPGETLKFIKGGASASDCTQGDIGDCWFISALSVCANEDEKIVGGKKGIDPVPGMIVDNTFAQECSKGIFPPIFHKYRAKGIYCLRYFKNFDWIYVIVDERVPCKKGTKDPCFGHNPDSNEMWV